MVCQHLSQVSGWFPPRRGKLLLTLQLSGYKNFPDLQGNARHQCTTAQLPPSGCAGAAHPQSYFCLFCIGLFVFVFFVFLTTVIWKRSKVFMKYRSFTKSSFKKMPLLAWNNNSFSFSYLHIEICSPILHLTNLKLYGFTQADAPKGLLTLRWLQTSRLQIMFHKQTRKENCSFLLVGSFHVCIQMQHLCY